MRVLLIDDIREPSYIQYAYGVGVTDIAKTYDSGIQALIQGNWDLVLLDHDLADFKDGVERTGYSIMCFLEENPQYLPKQIRIVSDNPVGRQRMQSIIYKLYKK